MNVERIISLVKEASGFVFDESLRKSVDMKGSADFVTAVDLKISGFLKEKLAEITPEIGFMSEEETGEIAEKRWILDPIDGTTNLVYDYNFSSVSLAYFNGSEIEFGVIYNPYNGELFTAYLGNGAYLNGKRLNSAPDREIGDCLIEFGAGSTKKQYIDESFAIGKEVFRGCLDIRRVCSSALAIAYVAAGKINGYFERSIKPWDYAAATLMLKETGCLCSDWEGNAIQFETASSYVCGTKKAYDFLLKTINEQKTVL